VFRLNSLIFITAYEVFIADAKPLLPIPLIPARRFFFMTEDLTELGIFSHRKLISFLSFFLVFFFFPFFFYFFFFFFFIFVCFLLLFFFFFFSSVFFFSWVFGCSCERSFCGVEDFVFFSLEFPLKPLIIFLPPPPTVSHDEYPILHLYLP